MCPRSFLPLAWGNTILPQMPNKGLEKGFAYAWEKKGEKKERGSLVTRLVTEISFLFTILGLHPV